MKVSEIKILNIMIKKFNLSMMSTILDFQYKYRSYSQYKYIHYIFVIYLEIQKNY
jgi:hypothetical protein